MAGDRTAPQAARRVPPLLRAVLAWALGFPVLTGVRLLLGQDDSWTESVLSGALFTLSMLPAWLLVPVWLVQREQKWHPAYGAGPVQDEARRRREEIARRWDDERALARALRAGAPPEDDELRAELPAYLAWRRRGAVLALATGLPLITALVLVGRYDGGRAWSIFWAVVALLLAGWCAVTLVRAGRLGRVARSTPTPTPGPVA